MRLWIAVILMALCLFVRGAAMCDDRAEGPGISDAEFFNILNLDYPGMEKVKAAVGSGDIPAAKHEFAEYLRHREKPVWKLDGHARPKHDTRPAGINTENADRVLNGEVWSCDVWHKFDGPIDWNLNPFGYKEWTWGLNRHGTWIWLTRAYWDTGEEKYAQECVRQIQDWVRRCPAPKTTSGNETYTWRTIEQGIRMGQTWPEIYCRLLTSPSFTDDAMVMMVKSMVEHARVLTRNATTGNWLTMESNGLMHVGVLFPEFKEAEGWRKTATDRLYAELDRQVYPDGAQIELSTGYHQIAMANFVMAWEIAHLNNVPMPADYVAKVQKMYDYDLSASMPDGCLPALNDAPAVNIRVALKAALTYWPDREDFRWMATGGSEGKRPSVGSVALPFAGHLVMRTGYDPQDLYLLFDAGPYGYGHQHEDALSFVIYSQGRRQVIDAGSYAYDSSQWRKYVISTRGHNTIRVDGQDQHRGGRNRLEYVLSKPLPNKWIAGDGFDYASGAYTDGYGSKNDVKVVHSRSIFFVKPEYWIVTDLLTPSDPLHHSYESLFHLDADAVETDGTVARTVNKESSNLSIIPAADDRLSVRIVSGQEKPVVQGWIVKSGYEMRPLPTAVYSKNQSGITSFQYIFYPTPKGARCPITGVRKLDMKSGAGMEIIFQDGHKDYFVQTQDHSGTKFLDFETDADAVFVRVKDGKVVKAMLAGGKSLTQNGKAVPAEIREITDLSKTKQTHKF